VPIYEYLCEGCGTLTELMQKVGEPPPRKCPECGSRKIAKLVSRTTFRLKGGGWYADLYSTPSKDGERKGTHAPPASADSAPAAPAPSEGEGSRPAPAAKGAAGPKASKGRRSKGS
jgi:putative FmdB family regulatory protein